mgnify:FL=1
MENSRLLKFRAWDRIEKSFRYFTVGEFGDTYRCEPFQQYVGLKDKKFKDIYEGDLLIHGEDKDAIFEVFYNNNEAKFSCNRVYYKNSRCGGYLPPMDSKGFEIIGNVHENPGLLK